MNERKSKAKGLSDEELVSEMRAEIQELEGVHIAINFKFIICFICCETTSSTVYLLN